MKVQNTLGSFSLIFAALLGCSKGNERPANEPDDDSAAPTAGAETTSATAAIAQSRCAREQQCDNIGADKTYSSFADCEARIREDWRDDLSARECGSGVNQTQLNECLEEIRAEECGSPIDSLERMAACTQGQICED